MSDGDGAHYDDEMTSSYLLGSLPQDFRVYRHRQCPGNRGRPSFLARVLRRHHRSSLEDHVLLRSWEVRSDRNWAHLNHLIEVKTGALGRSVVAGPFALDTPALAGRRRGQAEDSVCHSIPNFLEGRLHRMRHIDAPHFRVRSRHAEGARSFDSQLVGQTLVRIAVAVVADMAAHSPDCRMAGCTLVVVDNLLVIHSPGCKMADRTLAGGTGRRSRKVLTF